MIKEHLIGLIQSGRLTESISLMISIVREKDDRQIHNDLILLASRVQANHRLLSMNYLQLEEFQQEEIKIHQRLLHCVMEAEEMGFLENIALEDLQKKTNSEKKKILFIASNPEGTPKFELEKEYLEIRKIFNRKREAFEVIESFDTTFEGFLEAVRIEKPEILHISCPSNNDFMIFHREDNTIRSIPYHILASVFSMFQPFVKCVFINTWCSPVFLKKISAYLNCAIGSSSLVDDSDAILFSSGFYTAISQENSFANAYICGRDTVDSYKSLDDQKPFCFKLFMNGLGCPPEEDTTPDQFQFSEPAGLLNRIKEEKEAGG